MRSIELSAGTIEYQDTGPTGPVVVLLHRLAMDGSLWRRVLEDLRHDHRVAVQTLPLGGHRRPMRPDADLSPRGSRSWRPSSCRRWTFETSRWWASIRART